MEKVNDKINMKKEGNPLLAISDLTLGFSNGKNEKIIFDKINATGAKGEIVALIGSNGRGKSTLLRTLVGLQQMFEAGNGKILYDGKDVRGFTHKDLSQMISFVSSKTDRANHFSVKDMLSINCYYKTNWLGNITDSDSNRISEALEMVGLKGFEERNSFELSDGEYQRATIAAAIVQDSQIIILDEPTAFLDIANRFIITQLLQKIAHEWGKLIIFSTHDLQLAIDMCDKIWLMTGDGFYDSTPQDLMDKGAFEKLFDDPRMFFNQTTRSFEMKNL